MSVISTQWICFSGGLTKWGLGCLMPLSTIFQLYRGSPSICGGNRNTLRNTDLSQSTYKLVEC